MARRHGRAEREWEARSAVALGAYPDRAERAARRRRVPLVTFVALPLVVIAAFVALDVIGHATNIITGLAVSLQATALPTTVIAAAMWIPYSVDGGLYGAALAAAAMLSMRDLAQPEIEAGADVRTALVRSGRTRLRSILMTATATIPAARCSPWW